MVTFLAEYEGTERYRKNQQNYYTFVMTEQAMFSDE